MEVTEGGQYGFKESTNVTDKITPLQLSTTSNGTMQHSASPNSDGFKTWVQKALWHGGSRYDAWFNAVSGQVGQVILSMPYSYSQMGFGLGIFFHLLYAGVGIWTCYMLSCLYLEYRSRKEKEGADFKRHVIQYHEVMGYLVGSWLKKAALFFNIVTMGSVAVVQIIACASNAYYLNSKYNKREWAIIFGGISILTCLLPSFHNFRVWSIMGVVTTTYTAWYMLIAGLLHGKIPDVKHSGPQDMEKFFTGTTNILFAFGGHAITVEIMHAMWQPKVYKYVYLWTVGYVLTITMPHCIVLYSNFGDDLLNHSNALSVLPHSVFRSIALCFMIGHQAVAFGLYVMPLNFMWEKVLGVHGSAYLIRVVCRVLVALLLCFLALLFPFFGPLNSLIGSIIMSFSVYIIPCVAYVFVYNTKTSRQIHLSVVCRVPVALWLCLLALLFPFFGPLNSLIGSVIMSFSIYIIPCVAYVFIYNTNTSRQEAAEKLPSWMPKWNVIVAINASIVVLIAVVGFCLGSWASVSNIIKQVHSFGLFEKYYQCTALSKESKRG